MRLQHTAITRCNSCRIWIIILMLVFTPSTAALAAGSEVLNARDPIAGGVELRVLPIGDSITWGAQSSDEAGYRKSLHSQLSARGNKVDFAGSMSNGQGMDDRDHEGHRGFTIDGIADASLTGIYAAPNIVLLHAGTNDMKDGLDLPNAPRRLGNLIDLIFDHSEGAVVLVCQIIPSTTSEIQSRVEDFNNALPALVDGYSGKRKVALVAMNKALGTSDLADNLHPNDGGYLKMADAYYAAIQAADEKGWIAKPGKYLQLPDSTSAENCKATPSWYNVGRIADGAKVAASDGPFKPSWYKKGVIAEGACPRARLHFMDLDGDGLKDYACVDPETGATDVWLNIPDENGRSSGKWNKLGEIATGAKGRDGGGVMFADLNGDGRDDYIYVDPDNGDVSVWINRLKNDAGVWQWQSLGRIAGGVGATNKTLQMVDIDACRRRTSRFCLIDPDTGELTVWLNTGADDIPDFWKLGVIGTGASAAPGTTVYLGDFTGEGRADYMIVGAGGRVRALTNRLQETTLAPRWLEDFVLAEGPDGAEQEQVHLVDMTGDGKVDYLLVGKNGRVTLWENNGTGGKYQPGEGVFLCDLDGDGTSDYFWIDHTGKGWGYLNIGKGKNEWSDLGQIATGDHRRENIRMAVLTRSKRADYVVLDEETGRAEWFENLGPDAGWGWRARGEIAAGLRNTIETQFGWKFKAQNVRFADLDGDGLDDYV